MSALFNVALVWLRQAGPNADEEGCGALADAFPLLEQISAGEHQNCAEINSEILSDIPADP